MNADGHLNAGAMIFPDIDQLDFTGPFEVLSRLPNSSFHVWWKEKMATVRKPRSSRRDRWYRRLAPVGGAVARAIAEARRATAKRIDPRLGLGS